MTSEKSKLSKLKNSWVGKNPIYRYFERNGGILIALFLICVVLSFTVKSFLTSDNIFSVLRQISINALLAFGMAFVLISGSIDLSVGSNLCLSGCATVIFINLGMSIVLAILIGIAIGLVVGTLNGLIISRTSIPPYIATLAMQIAVRGLCYIVTGGKANFCVNPDFNAVANQYIGPIPIPVVIVVIFMIVCVLVLSRTRFGRRVYAVGGNREAALYSGIDVKKIKLTVYIISGFMAACAGILLASRVYSAQPVAGVGYEGDAIAAAVVGGTSFHGGVGTIGGVIIGALILGVLNNALNLLEVQYYWQYVVKGAVILFTVYLDTLRHAKTMKKA